MSQLKPSWQDRAACKGRTHEMFHLPGDSSEACKLRDDQAKARYCSRCEVVSECREASRDEPYGIWGAATARERGFRRNPRVGASPLPRKKRQKKYDTVDALLSQYRKSQMTLEPPPEFHPDITYLDEWKQRTG